MTSDFTSFSRRSLISNESKYRQSLEYRLFLAENPDFKKNQTLGAPPQRNLQQEYQNIEAGQPLNPYPSPRALALAQTLDLGPQKTLLNREKQFIQYAPVFNKADPYEIQSLVPSSSKTYASTMDRKVPSRRVNRWEPKTISNNAYDDLNERDVGFDLDQAIVTRQPAAGIGTGLMPQAPVAARQALSLRPQVPRTQLIQSAKMQMGPAPQPLPSQATLHTSILPELDGNPLLGLSEGERQRKIYHQEFMKFALSQAEGSINDVKERSRSKSRRARYQALREASLTNDQESSMVDIMNRTKALNFPNQLALKQRYAYSRAGSVARVGSATLVRSGSRSQNPPYLQSDQPVQNDLRNQQKPQQSRATPQPKVIDIGAELNNQPDLLEREQRKAEYKAQLFAQISEKNEKKRLEKQKQQDDEARLMNDYVNYYRFGALRQGGGSPIRDRNGEIISQHIPFSSQSQHNGGVEEAAVSRNNYDRRNGGQVPVAEQSSYGQAFGATGTRDAEGLKMMQTASQTYSPKKQEIQHMKPSNMFEDITEQEFNQREQDKKAYQNDLLHQMQEAAERKRAEKDRIRRQEIQDDAKIYAALDQMREAFRKEENPNDRESINARSNSQLSHGPPGRSILKSQDRDISRQNVAQTNLNASMPMPQTPEQYGQASQQSQPDFFQPQLRVPSSIGVDEQLERLRRVQDEIEAKHQQDKRDTDKIFKDLLDSNRRLSQAMSGNTSPYNTQLPPASLNISNVKPINFDHNVSGNIRLESQFTRISQNPSLNNSSNVTPIRRIEHPPSSEADTSIVGGYRSSNARLTENKSAIGRLDELIEDFGKPGQA